MPEPTKTAEPGGPQERPRVLMTTSTLPRWAGDAEPRFVLDLARAMRPHADVELLAPHAPGARRRETLEDVPVSRYRYWIPRWQAAAYQGGMNQRLKQNRLRAFQLPFFLLAQTVAIARRLRQQPAIDLIHAHWLIPQGLAALIARRLAGRPEIPILCTSHGGDLFGLKGGLMTRLKRWVLQRCDATSVVSHAMAEEARRLEPDCRPEIIPMGTDLRHRFTPEGPNATERETHRLAFVGRLVEKKGLTHLLDALALFPEPERPQLDLVGDGPLRAELEQRADNLGLSGHVTFHGAIPHDRLPEIYRRAAIAVFPFVEAADGDQEGFGLVVIEAMGCGCAVIASDLPAVRDTIPDQTTGLRVPPADAEALHARIEELLNEPERIRALAEGGRKHALAHYDWLATADTFGTVYATLAHTHAGHHP